MATPKEPVWKRDPHTAAKHQLLRRYLQAWCPIVLGSFGTATYLEGFAGPGIYEAGEPGSPVIAHQQISAALRSGKGHGTNMALIEESPTRLAILKEQIATKCDDNPRLKVTYRPGRCAEQMIGLLEEVGAFGKPIFAFLDSWGGPDIPFALLERIAANNGSEVLLTFGPAFLTRFGTDPQHAAKGDAQFGGTHWQGVYGQPKAQKGRHLADAYRYITLPRAGFTHTLAFEMRDEGGRGLWLIFGTKHPAGLEKMKDAMWNVDPYGGVRYVDPADPAQIALDIRPEPFTGPLRRELLARIDQEDKGATVAVLQDFALRETVYKPTHVISAVRALIQSGQLEAKTPGRLSTRTFVGRTPGAEQVQQLF
ncbi:three-Cys-motif partner protein TcmP [Actinocrinis puniceicyclus]|uniref:Three-Cys-motif partner protein TcmP n=1 Tax=Actinocrinis puniceicyclus TaxID=977794 RepID=A0A8J7WU09_9ACTN|nr:three-Cys-motif partner protein TcmP [Actinocrinis puniceicyclus]